MIVIYNGAHTLAVLLERLTLVAFGRSSGLP
jgi:hypothetical protein